MARKVVSASNKQRKRTPTVTDDKVVSSYLAQLEAALGTADFLRVYETMEADKAVRQPEAVAIGSRFVASMAASTTRSRAFERILNRHKNMVSFKLKQRAVGGRSAA